MELYRKIYIKSEEDLPKKDGFYFVNWTPGHAHHTTMAAQYYDESIKSLWFGKGWFDWYLQPIEITELQTPIEDGLYSTGIFTQDECSVLAEGLLSYINDYLK